MTPEQAEVVALTALGWIAGQEDLLGAFLGAAGTDLATLGAQATDPLTQGAVLDFLLADDALVRAFCAAQDLRPEVPMAARRALPGGDEVHWT